MLIDWFTVAAQMVNFLILMALLKYFLYDRVIKAMDEREAKIHARLQQAEALQQEAARESEMYQQKNRDIGQKRDQVLVRVEAEAAHRREELLHNARKEIEVLRARWRESLEKEQKSFLQQLRLVAAGQVFAISRRALADLADSVIEKKVIDSFLARLESLGEVERQETVNSIIKEGGLVVVRSAGKMSPVERRKITATLHRLLADSLKVEYETVPEMIMGIELLSRGQKIAWNLDDYLERLETLVREALETEEESHLSPSEIRQLAGDLPHA